MTIIQVILIFTAGIGGGIVTGLIGASAVVIITPILSTLAGYSAYSAIGISLGTDVIASLVSAKIYHKYGNTNLKDALLISVVAMITAFWGSFLASALPDSQLGVLAGIATCIMGIQFIRYPLNVQVRLYKRKLGILVNKIDEKYIIVLFGIAIGLNCGFLGAGGGIMILVLLTFVLNYDIKKAIGTSVFIMSLTAASGSITHFIFDKFMFLELLICGFGGIIGAYFASHGANKIREDKLSKTAGYVFLVLGIMMTINKIIK